MGSWQLWLGAAGGILIGIVANLLTPLAKPVWTTFLTLLRYGRQAAIRNEIRNTEAELKRFRRYRDRPSQDLAVYLSQWILGILTVFSFGALCNFLSEHSPTATPQMRRDLLQFAAASFILSVILALIPLLRSSNFTSAGIDKRIAALEHKLGKLNSELVEP